MAGVVLRTESTNPLTYNQVDNNFEILRYFQEHGYPLFDPDITYNQGAWVKGSDGVVYWSKVNNNTVDPVLDTNGTNWDDMYYVTKEKLQETSVVMAIALG